MNKNLTVANEQKDKTGSLLVSITTLERVNKKYYYIY